MDGTRFDNIARRAAAGCSRRRALAMLGGAFAAGLLGRRAGASDGVDFDVSGYPQFLRGCKPCESYDPKLVGKYWLTCMAKETKQRDATAERVRERCGYCDTKLPCEGDYRMHFIYRKRYCPAPEYLDDPNWDHVWTVLYGTCQER